jgi:hypothetical protein
LLCCLDELSDEDKLLSRRADPRATPITEDFTFGYRVTQRALKFIKAHRDANFSWLSPIEQIHLSWRGRRLVFLPLAVSLFTWRSAATPAFTLLASDKNPALLCAPRLRNLL